MTATNCSRRDFILASATWPALAWAGAVRAQAPAKVRRIGLLASSLSSDTTLWHEAFRLGLRERGWVEGKNISIEYRYAEGRRDRLPELAAELVRLKVDLIVATVVTDALAAQKATTAIPIVMAAASDPVASGLVASLARPGGNISGLSQMTSELNGKRLEMLKEMVPKLARVAVLWNPQNVGSVLNWKEIQLPARQLGLQLHSLEVRGPAELDKAFEDATKARVDGLAATPDQVFTGNMKRIVDFAGKNRLPAIFYGSEFADAGALMAYGPDRADMFRRAATFVDKILKGRKPADLPVEQPTKFELVVNMKTAKALGITIPQTILIRVDRMIE